MYVYIIHINSYILVTLVLEDSCYFTKDIYLVCQYNDRYYGMKYYIVLISS